MNDSRTFTHNLEPGQSLVYVNGNSHADVLEIDCEEYGTIKLVLPPGMEFKITPRTKAPTIRRLESLTNPLLENQCQK